MVDYLESWSQCPELLAHSLSLVKKAQSSLSPAPSQVINVQQSFSFSFPKSRISTDSDLANFRDSRKQARSADFGRETVEI